VDCLKSLIAHHEQVPSFLLLVLLGWYE
jgi:hypothetical protein